MTDPQFARRVREAFEHDEDRMEDMVLLRYGRHFRLPGGAKVIVGRNQEENSTLCRLAGEGDSLLEVVGFGSPITVLRGRCTEDDIRLAASICARYSDCDSGLADVRAGDQGEWRRSVFVQPADGEYLEALRIG